jgi:addiction module HigA family antidote
MVERIQNQYYPDYVSPPGETLLELIEERGMSQADLARRMGRPRKTINEIIKGKTAITTETAIQLERVLGVPARFWNNRQLHFDQYKARTEEEIKLRYRLSWLQKFPIKAMIIRGWIPEVGDDVGQLRELLNFFGTASPDQWESLNQTKAVFRKTAAFESDPFAVAAWLRKGEIEAEEIRCKTYHARAFERILIEKVRPLTSEPPKVFQPALESYCASVGVAVASVPQLPKAHVSGATRWLSPGKALIQLSLRYKTDDQLWFSFFHEAGHILLHGKRDLFIEDPGMNGEKEDKADKFAADTLIPPVQLRVFLETWTPNVYPSTSLIMDFADYVGVAPGIVVGRLQHDGHVPFSHYNHLKRRLAWVDENER